MQAMASVLEWFIGEPVVVGEIKTVDEGAGELFGNQKGSTIGSMGFSMCNDEGQH
ncbi:conserved hypothetical protein [Ricinus communis]|uniref:Uncharacterized protein n=1 Tax=Ricinus communis TaxID=3988 RepID=B9S5F9_RICCO|nr:conserved hypothetical protein [Ricinus communis]